MVFFFFLTLDDKTNNLLLYSQNISIFNDIKVCVLVFFFLIDIFKYMKRKI